jgi:hypothetical protein
VIEAPRSIIDIMGQEWWKALPDIYGERLVPRWVAYHWIKKVTDVCVKAIEDGNGRVIINVPPRHGKTWLAAKILPAWFIDKYRHKQVITCSASLPLSTESGRKTRDILRTAGVTLAADQHAKGQWLTEQGGGMKATSVGKAIMGEGFDLALVDDLYGSWADAQSPGKRAEVVDWFLNTLYNRRETGSTIIVLMTRFHPEDLSGYLIAKHPDPWKVVRLPAIAEADDWLGRDPGEALLPERWPIHELERSKLGGSADGWASMYQQAPSSVGAFSVYRNFSDANVDSELVLRPDLPLDISWDFNTNPGCHCLVGQYDKLYDQFTVVYEVHSPRMTVVEGMDQLEKIVKSLGGFKWRGLRIFGDSTGNSRAAGYGVTHYQTVEAKAKSFGWGVPMRCVPLSAMRIPDRINCFNEVLFGVDLRRRYRVHPRCAQLLTDFREQRYDEKGVPDKTTTNAEGSTLGHAGDAEGYRVHYCRPMIQKKRTDQRQARFIA